VKLLFRVSAPIPELRARTGEYIIVDGDGPLDEAISVMNPFGPDAASAILNNLGSLKLMTRGGPTAAVVLLEKIAAHGRKAGA
jgi:hypothetical protein